MTEEDVRHRVVSIARGILSGETDVLEGSRILSDLLGRLSLQEDDEDHRAFILIDSETDALPVGRTRDLWDRGVLRGLESEIRASRRWALEIARPHCENLITRFAPS